MNPLIKGLVYIYTSSTIPSSTYSSSSSSDFSSSSEPNKFKPKFRFIGLAIYIKLAPKFNPAKGFISFLCFLAVISDFYTLYTLLINGNYLKS